MQNNSPLRTLLITCAALALIAVVAYAYLNSRAPAGQPSSTGSTTTQTLSDGTVITVPAGATVQEEDVSPQGPVAPDYRAKVAYSSGTSAEVRAAIEPRLAADIALLDKNSQNFSAWMDLAILHKIGGDYRGAEVHKIGGDYRGAEVIWLYATKVWPKSSVAFHNLADLYQNFLNEPAKAQFYSDQATKLGAQ